jgi:hypothetical protein
VVSSRHLDGRRTVHHYDHLVLALGTTDRLDVYPSRSRPTQTPSGCAITFSRCWSSRRSKRTTKSAGVC